MSILLIKQWFSDDMLRALCWTLIHSLWQGLLAAALAGIVILGTKKSPARVRYNLMGGVLLLFLFAAACTFFRQLHTHHIIPPTNASRIADKGSSAVGSIMYAVAPVSTRRTIGLVDSFVMYFNRHAALVVLLWGIFFMARCLKLFTGLNHIHHIRTHKVHEPAAAWARRLSYLSNQLGIGQTVRLLESELVKVPVAIGYLRPVILLPLGLLANLPPDQAETILLHELAHIRRRDYFVNLLQSIVETVFFFNPAVTWISSLLRDEREACCDDMVMANTSYKGSYLEALVSFHEYRLAESPYAMALGGKRTPLLDRVKRMLTHENKKLHWLEKTVILLGLFAIMAFNCIPREAVRTKQRSGGQKQQALYVHAQAQRKAAALQKPQQKNNMARPVAAVYTPATVADTTPAPVTAHQKPANAINYDDLRFTRIRFFPSNAPDTKDHTITVMDEQGRIYRIDKNDGQITGLSIEGREIPSAEIGNYNGLIQKIFKSIEEHYARKRYNLANRPVPTPAQQLAYKPKGVRPPGYSGKVLSDNTKLKNIPVSPIDNSKMPAPVKRMDTGKPVDARPKKNVHSFHDDNFEKDLARVKGVIADIVKQKFASNAAAVEYFELSEKELVVNGQKLPEGFHQSLKERYGIRPHYGLFYGPCKKGGPGVIFGKEDVQ